MRLLLTVLLLAARPAEAHIVSSRLGDFYAGMIHPLTALPDLVLWLALGALAATQPAAVARWLVPLFPLGLVAGLVLGVATGWTTDPAALDAGLMLLLGVLVAVAARLPAIPFLAGATALAAYRGLANASGVTPASDVLLFAGGTAVVGYAAITLATAGLAAFRRGGLGWQAIAIRAGGSWIAAIGLMVGGFALLRP